MAEPKFRWRVDTWEYERGWGRRPMGTEFFDTEEEALEFVRIYNEDNTETVAPDCYFVADAPVKVQVA